MTDWKKKYETERERADQLQARVDELLAGGRYLLDLEEKARAKADILDYLLADITARLPAALTRYGFIELHPRKDTP